MVANVLNLSHLLKDLLKILKLGKLMFDKLSMVNLKQRVNAFVE